MLRFGTDGIRGDATAELMSASVVALGRAAARVLGTSRPFVIGRDTRESGARIVADLGAGIVAEGGQFETLGVVPTPGVAHVAKTRDAPGAVVSASHNPWWDNGIKFFSHDGIKLDDDDGPEDRQAQILIAVSDPVAICVSPAVSTHAYRIVRVVISAMRSHTSNSCSKRRGR